MSFEDIIKQSVTEAIREEFDRRVAQLQVATRPLTLTQLADEWQCSKQAIINWTRRQEYRLPVHYIGSEPRFHRDEIDGWSREEAVRKLAKAA